MRSGKRGRSLAEVMSAIDDEPKVNAAAKISAGLKDDPRPAENGSVPVEPTGQAVVPINILVAPEDRRRLRQLSLDTNLSLQKLGHEAWNLLLQKRGLPPLKAVSANVPSGAQAPDRGRIGSTSFLITFIGLKDNNSIPQWCTYDPFLMHYV